ncbi:MAG TPA: accessory gene regulator B family protein [Firmicutes bacterium]|nr:accessory gene regulator B family protein [Bacillota bacterium]
MIASFCAKVCDYFVTIGVIESGKKDLYIYGLHQGIVMFFNIITTLLVGCILGMVWQSIVFLLAYIPIRSYAGGYHAKTPVRCYCISVILITATLLAMKYVTLTPATCWGGILGSSALIFILAPIEDKNKPFTPAEKKVFQKRSRILLGVEFSVGAIAYILGYSSVCFCVLMSLVTLSVMLILGKIKNYVIKRNNSQNTEQ